MIHRSSLPKLMPSNIPVSEKLLIDLISADAVAGAEFLACAAPFTTKLVPGMSPRPSNPR